MNTKYSQLILKALKEQHFSELISEYWLWAKLLSRQSINFPITGSPEMYLRGRGGEVPKEAVAPIAAVSSVLVLMCHLHVAVLSRISSWINRERNGMSKVQSPLVLQSAICSNVQKKYQSSCLPSLMHPEWEFEKGQAHKWRGGDSCSHGRIRKLIRARTSSWALSSSTVLRVW